MIDGKPYDGLTAHAHPVRVEVDGDTLRLSQDSGWSEEVAAASLKRIESSAAGLRLGNRDKPGWRLILPADAEDALAPLLGARERYGRWIDRIGLVPALAAGAALTASVVVLGYLAPHWIAPHVPMSWERDVGTAMVGDFGDIRCRDVRGQR